MPKKSAKIAKTLLDEFVDRASSQGLQASRETWSDEGEDDDPGFVAVEMLNGPSTRRVIITEDDIANLAAVDLGKITMLGHLEAFLDRTTGTIEAKVIQAGPAGMTRSPVISRLPFPQSADLDAEDEVLAEEDARVEAIKKERPFSLHKGDTWLEMGPASPVAAALFAGPSLRLTTIRLHGYVLDRHDEALRVLEEIAGALFFDMDVLYNIHLQVAGRRTLGRRSVRTRSKQPPEYPANHYQEKALSLYRYGRSAQGLPLLEFLAYYQAVEFFFPAFSHAETSFAMRALLLDPRFNPADDADVSRLIRTAAPAVRAGIGERDQLKATLRSVVQVADLRAVLEELNATDEYFTAKRQLISGVSPLRLGGDDLREQLAERIYAIRCRIVHSKDGGGANSEELLLPTGQEAGQLFPDIAVIRYIAQQAIIAQAQR